MLIKVCGEGIKVGKAELEIKKQADSEPTQTPLADWALRPRRPCGPLAESK